MTKDKSVKTESGTGQTTKRNYRFCDDGGRKDFTTTSDGPSAERACGCFVGCRLCLGVCTSVLFAQSGSVQSGLLCCVDDDDGNDEHQRCRRHGQDVISFRANGIERDRTTSERKLRWRQSGAALTERSTQQERVTETQMDTEGETQWLSTTTSPFRFVSHPVRPIVHAFG